MARKQHKSRNEGPATKETPPPETPRSPLSARKRFAFAALALKPDLTEGHAALGRLFMEHGYFKEAEPRLRYALSLEPAHLEAMERLAILRERAGDGEEAAALLARCIAEAERRGDTVLAARLRQRRAALAPDAAP